MTRVATPFRLRMAKQKAEALLREEGIVAQPVDPFAIAASRDITVRPKRDTAEGVSGMLLRHGDAFGILYATSSRARAFSGSASATNSGTIFWTAISTVCCPGTAFTLRAPASYRPIRMSLRPTILRPDS